jgi:two-component system, response regulator PdtaR
MNLLLIEDEAILAMTLCDHLEAEGYTIAGIASTGERAIELFQQHDIDLVLCDITIKGEWDGIETVRRLNAIRQVPVIYLTAYADTATVARAKETYPAAYLTKPHNLTTLRLAIEIALNNLHRANPATQEANQQPAPSVPADTTAGRDLLLKNGKHLFIRQASQFVKIQLQDILVLEADDSYTTIHTTSRTYLLRVALGTMLERLDHPPLVRVHRSYAINIEQVATFDDAEIRVRERVVPLGRHFKEQFLQRLHGQAR